MLIALFKSFVSVANVQSFVRHALTSFGGSLVTSGLLSSSDVQTGIGAAATLAGLAWSYYKNIPKGA